MKIIISPFSNQFSELNAKNYPYWKELIALLNEHEITQIGIEGEEKLTDDFRTNLHPLDLLKLLKESDVFISVDNFFPHFANYHGMKGIVLFSRSSPEIFGYDENINLLKDVKYLREDQFGEWRYCPFIKEAFVSPEEVIKYINQ